MAHFAQLDENNKVLNVVVVSNDFTHDENGVEQESLGIAYCKELFGENTKWVQTSYNGNFKNKFAGIGDIYLEDRNIFLGPQPFPSWSLSLTENKWIAPIAEIENNLGWDEENQTWILKQN
jgi:hypothetical protein